MRYYRYNLGVFSTKLQMIRNLPREAVASVSVAMLKSPQGEKLQTLQTDARRTS